MRTSVASVNRTNQVSTPSQSSNILPKRLDLNKWQDTGFVWQGNLPLSYFSRLSALCYDDFVGKNVNDVTKRVCDLSCTLEKSAQILWLSFSINTKMPMQCQRCLDSVDVTLNKSHRIALLTDDRQVSAVGEQDYVLLTDLLDYDEKEHVLPLAVLLEDELLLDLPLSPKHEDCEVKVQQVGELPEVKKDNPFAALATLKR